MRDSRYAKMVKKENPKEFKEVWYQSLRRTWISRLMLFSFIVFLLSVVLAFIDGFFLFLPDGRIVPSLLIISILSMFGFANLAMKEESKVAKQVGYPWEDEN